MSILNIGDSQTFVYTGNVQTFTVDVDGLYELEVYGGKGGGNSGNTGYGGNGGYSKGYIELNAGQTLYIVCGGGNNNTYNGGGAGNRTAYSGAGGGATHIATVTGTLASIGASNIDKILIVAGGGGGGGYDSRYGGSGGGLSGGDASGGTYIGYGGTQTQGGKNYYWQSQGYTSHYTYGSFGQGGTAETGIPGAGRDAGGGGGGLYGGGGGSWSNGNTYNGAGGGGSGYIGGVPEIVYQGVTYSPSTLNGQNTGNGSATITLIALPSTATCRLKVNGSWVDGKMYFKVNGQWVEGKSYIKVNGQWKEGI